MMFEKLSKIALVIPGTSPKGELINKEGVGFPFFQGSKEFGDLYPIAERYTELPVKLAKQGDILISVRAPVGEVNFATEDCSIGRGVMSVRANNYEDQKFIFYFLKNLQGKWDSLGSTGSVFENLSTSALGNIDVPTGLPRRVIGDVLFNLDSKLAANTSLSKTLEDLAQTLFKSWFIDFDPVRAKLAGNKPAGVDEETASLFPDSLVESELGLIPIGWTISTLGDELRIFGGTTPSTSEPGYWNGTHSWITPKDLSKNNGIISLSSERAITDDGLNQISSGLAEIESVIMSCRAPIGYLSINAQPTAVNQGCFTIRKSDKYSALYVLNLVNSNMPQIKNRAGGATFAEITRKSFKEIPIIVPSIGILKKYMEVSDPLIKELINLARQNDSLKLLRDSILPRLISGELQIPDEMLAS